MSLEDEYQNRLKRLEELKSAGAPPYPNGMTVGQTAVELNSRFGEKTKEELEGVREPFVLAGRVMLLRSFGKAAFWRIKDRTGIFQLFVEEKTLSPEAYRLSKLIDLGDIVWVKGILFRTKTNELTLKVEELKLAAKALRPLPEKWHGLQDVETRYRQRYLDLISNDDVKEVFRKRSQIIQTLREFLGKRNSVRKFLRTCRIKR